LAVKVISSSKHLPLENVALGPSIVRCTVTWAGRFTADTSKGYEEDDRDDDGNKDDWCEETDGGDKDDDNEERRDDAGVGDDLREAEYEGHGEEKSRGKL
jgi:hypothetical protein